MPYIILQLPNYLFYSYQCAEVSTSPLLGRSSFSDPIPKAPLFLQLVLSSLQFDLPEDELIFPGLVFIFLHHVYFVSVFRHFASRLCHGLNGGWFKVGWWIIFVKTISIKTQSLEIRSGKQRSTQFQEEGSRDWSSLFLLLLPPPQEAGLQYVISRYNSDTYVAALLRL